MRILLSTDVIHAGGAETFVLRLAHALQQEGHEVVLYVLYKDKIDYKLIHTIAPKLKVVASSLEYTRIFQLVDGLLLKFKVDYSLVDYLLIDDLKRLLEKQKFDLIHSHLFTTDKIAIGAAKYLNIPVVTTMHGDYSLLWEKERRGLDIRMLYYSKKMIALLQQLRAVVCISNQQLQFFDQFKSLSNGLLIKKIYNGYKVSEAQLTITKESLQIPPDHFVFGMVARGIPEKGWREVITAFIAINTSKLSLVLIGDSAYVQDLKAEYSSEKNIHFIGYSKNPVEYILLFDVGLFASTYMAESLPTVIMEYLACQVPVISSDIAECRKMLETESGYAGLLINLTNNSVATNDLKNTMLNLMENKLLYNKLKSETTEAFKKFDMHHCVAEYLSIYKHVISKK